MECKKHSNLKNCNCSYPCPGKGICCDCVAYHRSRKELPACYFPANAERTYDRSIAYFMELNK